MKKNKVALILEGGGLRGLFTAGVLDCFIDYNIDFDYVCGVSAGACNAFAFIAKERGYLKKALLQKKGKDSFYGVSQMLESHKYVNLDKVFYDYAKKYDFDFDKFKNSSIDWEMVATNIETGLPEYLHSDDIEEAKIIGKASCSLPLFTDPVEYNDKLYLDGGIADSIPYQHCVDKGYKRIVVICTRKKGNFSKVNAAEKQLFANVYKKYPNFLKAVKKRTALYKAQVYKVEQDAEHGDAFLIRPTLPEIGRLESDLEELSMSYYHGYTKAIEYLDSLKRYMQ